MHPISYVGCDRRCQVPFPGELSRMLFEVSWFQLPSSMRGNLQHTEHKAAERSGLQNGLEKLHSTIWELLSSPSGCCCSCARYMPHNRDLLVPLGHTKRKGR